MKFDEHYYERASDSVSEYLYGHGITFRDWNELDVAPVTIGTACPDRREGLALSEWHTSV